MAGKFYFLVDKKKNAQKGYIDVEGGPIMFYVKKNDKIKGKSGATIEFLIGENKEAEKAISGNNSRYKLLMEVDLDKNTLEGDIFNHCLFKLKEKVNLKQSIIKDDHYKSQENFVNKIAKITKTNGGNKENNFNDKNKYWRGHKENFLAAINYRTN